jgi:hypothetical protein
MRDARSPENLLILRWPRNAALEGEEVFASLPEEANL